MRSRLKAYWAKNLWSLRMWKSRSTLVGMAAQFMETDSLNHAESMDDVSHQLYSGKIHCFSVLHNREDLVKLCTPCSQVSYDHYFTFSPSS